MAETLLISDDEDGRAGFFFRACKEVMESYFENQNITYSSLTTPQIHHTGITAFAQNKESFIICSFSHGISNALIKGNQPYITNNLNGSALTGGFMYSFACSTGAILGNELTVQNGLLCYIGHSKKVYIWNNEFLDAFINCATIGLIEFYNGKTSFEIIEIIKAEIDKEIDRIYKVNYWVAADLKKNKKSLILHGIELCLNDLTT
ncbi:hypothetical protein [uncultured Lacinutrix sp.]|uniref:hypothetical protein n=1 Tax=uncultured Lacinutrix sp. TaxID=574032 RepID=UPI00261FD017|nr:hypothetical protein [uncultured Lacinutrix sp.]